MRQTYVLHLKKRPKYATTLLINHNPLSIGGCRHSHNCHPQRVHYQYQVKSSQVGVFTVIDKLFVRTDRAVHASG